MARIVCQVLHRADRISFLWSEGAASFEPYHLEGAERANLLDLAGQLHAQLAEETASAPLGHRLYRAVFRRDAGDPGSAAQVHPWFTEQAGKIDRLEILGDLPGLIPWNTLIDDPAGTQFWGARFPLGVGRRVNILRQNPYQVNPIQRMAADLDLVAQLTDAQRGVVNGWREAVTHTGVSLGDELKKLAPDILLLLVRFEQGQLRLGSDAFGVADLQRWIEEPREGNPDPIIILMGCGDAKEKGAWQALLAGATATFSGLVANETLLPPSKAFTVGQALAQKFVDGGKSLGEILQTLRQDQGAAGLAFSAFCPPEMRVVQEGAEAEAPSVETMPLPRRPYRPFAAFEASDRALFYGREEDTLRGALVADRAETCGVFLHGSPAVGKTSYLQAGLLPFLEQESVGYCVLRDRSPVEVPVAEKDYPPLILRATSDLAGQFADALTVFCAQPYVYTTPAGTQVTVDLPAILQQAMAGLTVPGTTPAANTAIQATAGIRSIADRPDDEEGDGLSHELWIALRDNKSLLASVLDAITRALPFELVIAVDQGEELVTLVKTAKQRERRTKALDMLAQLSSAGARCKIVYTLRSQSLGELVSLFPGRQTPAEWHPFYLRPLDEAEMVDALLWPTNREEIPYTGEVPAEKYGFAFEDGMAQQVVAEAIETAAADQQSPLPILQAVGALLYDKQVLGKKQNIVRMSDLKALGGVKEALSKSLDVSIEKLKLLSSSQRALRNLIGKLYVSHADGTLSRDVVPADELKGLWVGSTDPVEPIVNHAADEEGLFEIQQLMIGGQTDVYVSVAQDSLARLGKKIGGEKELHALGKTKVIDTLWIMIPLAFLCAAITFFVTRNFIGRAGDDEFQEKAMRQREQEYARVQVQIAYAEKTRRPIYYGQIARADQALRADNALRARQILVEEPASRNLPEDTKERFLPDLRGFEWRYLWKHLHSERYQMLGHRGAVASVAVSADGKFAASAGLRTEQLDDAAIRVWSLETGEELARIAGPKSGANAVAFSPDGLTLATAGADKLVYLWDLSKLKNEFVRIEKETTTLKGHADAIHALAFGKDGKTLASAGADKSIIVWDVAAGKEKHTLREHGAAVHALAFTSDGKTLASAGSEGLLVLWDADAGKKRESIKTPFQAIAAMTISPDGKTLAVGGVDEKLDAQTGVVRFFNVADGKEARGPIQHSGRVHSVAFRPDGAAVASGGNDFVVRLWNLKSGKEEQKWVGHYGAINSLAFAKDALVSGSADAKVKVWNPAQSSGPDILAAHADGVQCLALNKKNNLLASGGRDGAVKLWNPADGKLLATLPSFSGAVTAVAFSHDADKTFIAASTRDEKNEGGIKVWQIDGDVKTGYKAVEKQTLTGHAKGVTCLAFHPSAEQANLLVSGSADATVKVWDIATGKEKESHKSHKDEVRCVTFAPDGKSFASGGKDRAVCLYELGKKDANTLPDLHLDSIESIALMPLPVVGENFRGSRQGLLTGSADRTMRLWVIDSNDRGQAEPVLMRHFRSHAQGLTGVLFNDLGFGLSVSSSWDGTIKLFDLDSERYTLSGHSGAVRAIAMASDQSFLASAGSDGTIRIWRTGAVEVERAKVDGK